MARYNIYIQLLFLGMHTVLYIPNYVIFRAHNDNKIE